jgi:hypothetical protein
MSDMERDPEFEAFLKRRSPMHRRLSDLDHIEPSTELDRFVLTRAREAIESPPQAPVYRATRWAMPLGLAASILIAFTVVLNIDSPNGAAEKRVVLQTKTAAAPAPSAGSAHTESSREESTAAASAPSTALTDSADSAVSPEAQAEDSRATKAESSPLLASANGVRTMRPSPGVAAQTGAGASSAPPRSPSPSNADVHATAESWLREINRLRAAGKTAEAERELTAFREAYPSHPGYSLARPPTR